jgi:hypothetical protein
MRIEVDNDRVFRLSGASTKDYKNQAVVKLLD